jgi:hypothetical protein
MSTERPEFANFQQQACDEMQEIATAQAREEARAGVCKMLACDDCDGPAGPLCVRVSKGEAP